MEKTDFSVQDNGSLILFRPLTDEAREWLEEHTNPDALWWGGALAVERRYAADLACGILEACGE